MGEIVLAAKNTHVPSIWMSENFEQFKGIRDHAIGGLTKIGELARERGADTFLIFDTHWIVNQGFHLNANPRHQGTFTSHELPHFLDGMAYDYPGDPELAELIAAVGTEREVRVRTHQSASLGLEYGTLIPMHHMNRDGFARVLCSAANQFADIDEGRAYGEIVAEAIRRSDRKVAVLASGSLSHQFAPNRVSEGYLNHVYGAFNRQVDAHVMMLLTEGRIPEFLEMLPGYAVHCHGECGMIDTAHLFGAIGWDKYEGCGEAVSPYFGSSGTGQVNMVFDPPYAVG